MGKPEGAEGTTLSSKPPKRLPTALAPLTRTNRRGNVYQRSAAVESQIISCLASPDQEILRRAQISDRNADGYLQEEALVYLIRESALEQNQALYNGLSEVLLTRARDRLSFRFRAFEPVLRQDAHGEAALVLFERLLSTDGRGDFLQVRFWKALDRLAIDIFRRFYQPLTEERALLRPDASLDSDSDEEAAEGWEVIADGDGKIPDDYRQSSEELDQLTAEALQCLKEPIRTAFILRHFEDWPIESSDPADMTLSKYFKKTPRMIRYWLRTANQELSRWRGEHHA